MTETGAGAPQGAPEKGTAETSQRELKSATEALEELHRLLVDAGGGNADPSDVRVAIESYWGDQQDTLRSAASTLTEQVRLQTLQELYRWRARLARQLGTQPPARDAHSGSDNHP